MLLDLVPHLDSTEVTVRQGVVEALYCLSDSLTVDIVPYIVLLVVPVLGRMSDHNEEVRLLATNTFATLVKLMPLDAGVPDPQVGDYILATTPPPSFHQTGPNQGGGTLS